MNRLQALASIQAYLPEDTEIVKILNYCDLNPIDGWRIWQNEYSPYIKVQKDKKIGIRFKEEDYFVPKMDLYAYSKTYDVAKISKKLLFILNENNCLSFLFLGNDDKLRYRRYSNSIYINEPPLFVPIEDIRVFIKHENIDGHCSVKLAKKQSLGWVTSWPPSTRFYQEIKKEICNNQLESLIQDFCVM